MVLSISRSGCFFVNAQMIYYVSFITKTINRTFNIEKRPREIAKRNTKEHSMTGIHFTRRWVKEGLLFLCQQQFDVVCAEENSNVLRNVMLADDIIQVAQITVSTEKGFAKLAVVRQQDFLPPGA